MNRPFLSDVMDADPSGESMKKLFEAFEDAGEELYLVGGAVRDLALGASLDTLDDLDFATSARPEASLKILRRGRFQTYKLGIEFGTVGAVLKGPASEGYPKDVQITTYRSDEYYRRGSRHPVVKFGDTLEQDLGRRDFSINSIAMDAEGNFVDPYDGLGDIERETLRIIGDPDETLAEDPLRILRIGRFMAKLGFEPTEELRGAAYRQATFILDISRQRWFQEMNKLIRGPHVEKALTFLVEIRLLGIILPEVVSLVDLHRRSPKGPVHADFWEQTRRLVWAAGRDRILSWAALLANIGRPWTRGFSADERAMPGPELAGLKVGAFPAEAKAGDEATFQRHEKLAALLFKGISRRFHFDNDTTSVVEFLLEHQRDALAYQSSWSDADIRRFVRDMKGHYAEVIEFGVCLQGACGEGEGADLSELRERIDELGRRGELIPSLPSGLGTELIDAFELAPGPALGEIIDWLNEEIIAGRLASNLEPEAYIQHLDTNEPDVLREAMEAAGPSRQAGPKDI